MNGNKIYKERIIERKETLEILNDMSLKFLLTKYFFLLVGLSLLAVTLRELLRINEICFLVF